MAPMQTCHNYLLLKNNYGMFYVKMELKCLSIAANSATRMNFVSFSNRTPKFSSIVESNTAVCCPIG